jgi:hypothetical protein
MSLLGNIKSFLGFDSDEEKKKKQQQQQQQQSSSRTQVRAPRPGSIVLPNALQTRDQQAKQVVKQPDNHISVVGQPELPEVLKKATQNPVVPKKAAPDQKEMSNGEIVARSAGSVGTNFAGGLIGAAKGVVQIPSAVLSAPKLVKIGAAKVTKNKVAEDNAKASHGNMDQWSDNYNNAVAPVVKPLEKAEKATDDAALKIAPWNNNTGKTIAKVSANLVPFDAAVSGVSAASKASKASKLEKAAKTEELAASHVATVEAPLNKAPGLTSANPNKEIDALKQGQAEYDALPPAPEVDALHQAAQQAIVDGKAGDQAARFRQAQQDSLGSSVRPVTNPQGLSELPEGAIPVRQPIVPTVEPDAAVLAREQAAQVADPTMETPAYLHRLNTPEKVTDHLRTASTELARDPDFAPVIQEAFLQTGSKDPLSLAAHALSSTPDKGRVREMVSRLVPGADGNALNRAVNSVVGADNQADVLDALQTAIHRTNEQTIEPTPFGPLSDAPAVSADHPTIVSTRPDGQHVMSDGTVVNPATGEAAPLHVDTPEPTPAVAPAPDHATPNVPSFDEAAPLSKATTAPQKVENGVKSDVPTKTSAVKDGAPAKAVKEKPLEKTPQSDLPPSKIGGSAKTGEKGKSQGKYSKGQEYDESSNAASHERGRNEAANTNTDDFVQKIEKNDGMTGADRDAAVELQTRHKPGSELHRKLGDLINKYHTEAAQALGTIDRVIRKTADANHITDRFVNRLYKSTDENIKFTDKDFDEVIAKNEAFVKARDDQNAAIEAFNKDPSKGNEKDVINAFKQVDKADRDAKFTEYKTASRLTKGSKNPTSKAFVKDLQKKAGVYTMDWVDSSMLSSSRVMINNFINTIGVRNEEAMFGKTGAAIARKLTGTTIGGGSRKGAKLGKMIGSRHWRSDVALRQGSDENVLTKTIKNFTTTGNTIGDRNTYAAAYSGVFDHYRAKLKSEGYKGSELDRRAMVNSLADPDDIAFDYMNQALANNAMASITAGPTSAKIESVVADKIAAKLGGGTVGNTAAKLIVRMTVGFPTVIARSAAQGARRASLGSFSTAQAVKNIITKGPKEVTALHIKNAVKEAGSGATMYGIGAGLGAAGMITGSYPKDKAERDRWAREGITENSIKIGDDYYSLPSALGVFSLPFMIGANVSQHVRDGGKVTDNFLQDTFSTLMDSMPVDNIASATKLLTDMQQGKDVTDALAKYAASATRAVTPLGSLVNQVAKMFDPTANDTTKGDFLAQFVAKVQDGIPKWSNSLPDKTVNGKPIKNPDPIPKFFGATSTSQTEGVKKTQEIKAVNDQQTSTLKDAGVFTDKLRGVLDDDTKTIFDKAKNGEQVTPEEMKKLQSGLTKNVTATEDTRYLEDGDYDTNLAVLKAKKATLEADPTTQKGDIEKYDQQIARGEVYKELQTPYDDVKKYHAIDLTEWRDMGDPESDSYDPDTYEKLFDLDAALTDKGVSGKSSDSTKPKYYAKTTGSGSGGSSKSAAEKAASDALKKIQSNTIDNAPELKKVDLSDLRPQKIQSAEIPKIQQIRSSDLIKKRKITVEKA